jgi:hypothetical protein
MPACRLLQPPLSGVVTLGVDPAFRTGCKLAACDAQGRVLETGVVYPHPPAPEERRRAAQGELARVIGRHGVRAVAIGNGVASRETQRFVAECLAGINSSCVPGAGAGQRAGQGEGEEQVAEGKRAKREEGKGKRGRSEDGGSTPGVGWCVVSEAGASVYR